MTCQQKIIQFFQENLNNTIETSTFLEQLKYADVKPVFQKNSRTDKKNYRPMSVFPSISKIYERCLNTQLKEYLRHYYVNINMVFGKLIV